jgi:endonuclease/exonuclease/phosphatase (EEP) superfamily protein YafD
MLTPNTPLIKSPVIFENTVIPDEFSLLCWNIHKENFKKKFPLLIQDWKALYSLDLLILQEARVSEMIYSIAGFPFVGAANLSFPRYSSGVVTAASADPFSVHHIMTIAKEVFLYTRKTSLITIYRFKDKSPLMIVNVHAINFRSLSWYQLEFSRLYDLIKLHKGPTILAGDFNCWGKSRKEILNRFARSLHLEHARPRFPRYIKKWFGHRLDRIYFRDLVIVDVHALNCELFSDHNPIIARFARPKT